MEFFMAFVVSKENFLVAFIAIYKSLAFAHRKLISRKDKTLQR
jgi:hypothetical protein